MIKKMSIILCIVFMLIPQQIHAASKVSIKETGYTHTGTAWNESKTSGTYFVKQDISMIKVDGEVAFCIQPWQLVTSTSNYVSSNYSGSKRAKLEKIVYYGWKSSKQTSKDYAITQLMIWEEFGYKPTTSISNYASLKESVNQKILNYATKPSFNGTTINISFGQTKTITDKNGVLSDFIGSSSFSGSGITITKKNDSLMIQASEKAKGGTYSFSKIPNSSTGTSLVYKYQGDKKSQQIFKGLLADPIKANLKINVQQASVSTSAYANVNGKDVRTITYDSIEPTYTYEDENIYYEIQENDTWISIFNMYDETFIKEQNEIDTSIEPVIGNKILVEIKQHAYENPVKLTYTFKDKVKMNNLVSDKTYVLKGKMINKTTNKVIKESSLSFTCTNTSETKYVTFKDVVMYDSLNSIDLRDDDFVFYEYLYLNDVLISKHEDFKDTNQTISQKAPITTSFELYKKDLDTKECIDDEFQYNLYKDKECSELFEIGNSMDGKITYHDLSNGTYYLKEIDAPKGYLKDSSVYEIKVDMNSESCILVDGKALNKEDDTYILDVFDKKIQANLKVIKIDSKTNTNIQLDGFSFSLYEDVNKENCIETKEMVNGNVVFENLDEGTYYLYEKSTNSAYVQDEYMHKVDIKAVDNQTVVYVDGTLLDENTIDDTSYFDYFFHNDQKEVKVKIIKTNNNIEIKDKQFTFSLYADKECLNCIEEKTTVDSYVEYIIPYGKYYLKETKSDLAYVMDKHVYELIVEEKDGNTVVCIDDTYLDFNDDAFVYNFENTKKEYKVILNKKDSFDHRNIKDKDFIFEIDGKEVHAHTTLGIVEFDSLEADKTYVIKEVKAPEGYELDSSEHTILIKEDVLYFDDKEVDGYEIEVYNSAFKVATAAKKVKSTSVPVCITSLAAVFYILFRRGKKRG